MEQAPRASSLIHQLQENRITPPLFGEAMGLPIEEGRQTQAKSTNLAAQGPSAEKPPETSALCRQLLAGTQFQKLSREENPSTGLRRIKERGAQS